MDIRVGWFMHIQSSIFMMAYTLTVAKPKASRIVLREKPQSLADALKALPAVRPDFMKDGRQQPKIQRRRRIF